MSYLWIQKSGRYAPLDLGRNVRPHSHLDHDSKKQDHYAVLGLSHLRYKATKEQIKIARA